MSEARPHIPIGPLSSPLLRPTHHPEAHGRRIVWVEIHCNSRFVDRTLHIVLLREICSRPDMFHRRDSP